MWQPGQPFEVLADHLRASLDSEQRVVVLGQQYVGNDAKVRFRASASTNFVQLHVQHDGGGAGGATYDDGTFVSSAEVDCRENRQQDVTVTRNGTDHYYAWLIPVQKNAGDVILFDGVMGPDYATPIDLGT
jgi:hypothetical protein